MRYLLLSSLVFFLLLACGQSKQDVIYYDFDDQWDYYDPVKTEQHFRILLESSEQASDPDYRAQLLTQIARAQGLQGNFTAARASLEQAETLIADNRSTARIRYWLESGRLLSSSGDPEQSHDFFRQAYQLSARLGNDYYAIDAAHMLGIVSPAEEQLTWGLTALRTAESSEDQRARLWLGALYNNIGWTYHDAGEFQEALELFQKALNWRIERQDAYSIRIAKWSVARAYRSLGEMEKALTLQLELEQEIQSQQLPEDGYVAEELGEIYLAINDIDRAKLYFRKAYELQSQDAWIRENEPLRLERLQQLSD
ncbi:MAG: tetratricopeptide repeat protein [Candidatus Cloacimonetes bacterium]|nr:tetratricopeptide repeat protein [Candidatus Cloacimonadota bacterium]